MAKPPNQMVQGLWNDASISTYSAATSFAAMNNPSRFRCRE